MVNTGIGGWATALDAIRRYRPSTRSSPGWRWPSLTT